MTFVAVASGYKIPGFNGPGTSAPHRFQVMELRDALTRVYNTEAHLVTYVVPGAERQPRINKGGLPHWPGPMPTVGVLLADIDNKPHDPWTREAEAMAIERYETLEILQTAGIYHTKKGARVVQPLIEPIPVPQVELYIARWYAELHETGLNTDNNTRDWTRLFRLPNVRRDGKPYHSSYLNLDRMRPVELEPLDEPIPEPAIRSVTRPPAIPTWVNWRPNVPPEWRDRIQPIANAVRQVQSEWHSLFLALSGALLRRRVAPEDLPAVVGAISAATGADTRSEDRTAAAKTTVERHLAGQPFAGYGALARSWPAVADALDEVLSPTPEPASTDAPLPVPEAQAKLREAIRGAPDGLTLIGAECGLGKTAAAIDVAVERAGKQHASSNAQGTRAPLHSKTALSVDKHELALQVVSDLADRGIQSRRLFGPLSLKHPDGTPVCRLHDVARHLVAGGQPMQWELCDGRNIEPCPDREDCPAHEGAEGPTDARVIVGPHQLIGALDSAAGTTGLLVIDEPPDLLDVTPLRMSDLDHALGMLHAFDADFASALAPALEALIAWTEHIGPLGQCIPVREAITCAVDTIDEETMKCAQRVCGLDAGAVACAIAAQPDERTGKAPPIRFMNLKRARENQAYARKLGKASGVLRTLYHAVRSPIPSSVVIEQDSRGSNILVIITVRQQLAQALRREGTVVAMDANIAVNAPIFAKAVGYAPPLHQFSAADGAPVRRLHIQRRSAVRKYWLPNGKLKITPGLVEAVQDIVQFAGDTESLGIITMRTIELALRAASEPDEPQHEVAWREARQKPKMLADARDKLGPILRTYPGKVLFGHYGAVRGLNHMKDVDCLATLGDPWPNVGHVRHEADFLELGDSADSRMVELCRAELEQAHGRLRAVHRSRPARAVHVGGVRPGGYGWTHGKVKTRRVKTGRRPARSVMSAEEVAGLVRAAGSIQALSNASGISRPTISQSLKGAAVSERTAARLRAIRPQSPPSVGCRSTY